MKPGLTWKPIDATARSGRSVLLKRGADMALGKCDGEAFVYPATAGQRLDFEPTSYYDPEQLSAGAFVRV